VKVEEERMEEEEDAKVHLKELNSDVIFTKESHIAVVVFIGVARGDMAPLNFRHILSFCALTGGVPSITLLLAPKNIWGWLR